MAFRLLLLASSILFLFCSSFSFAVRITPRFPFFINRPEKFSVAVAKNELYEIKYFTQILDHFTFTPGSYQTFQQRYLINDKHWDGPEKNAPIFVVAGSEIDVELLPQFTGFMFDIAPHFQALVVFIEHRFYGKSIPFGGNKDTAYANASTLGYFTSTQALADYANLIIDLKKNLTADDSPVVIIGGSYGGMLAAWFRLKYPHVAIGALASSAPILNFENITSPYSFNNILTQDFRSESENCYQVIKKSWQKIKDTAKQDGGMELLRKSFKFCSKGITADVIIAWLRTAYINAAMADYPTPINNSLYPMPAYPVKQMCKAIDDPKKGNNTFEKIHAASNIFYNYTGNKTCFGQDDHSDSHDNSPSDGWEWQSCTEMIIPTEANNAESIFPPSEPNYTKEAQSCEETYKVQPRPNWITAEFGGHDVRKVLKRFGSNIIFFNGLRDPWSGGGVLKSISDTIVAIVAKEGAHVVDLRFSTSEDPEWFRNVRKKEINIIEKWISEY